MLESRNHIKTRMLKNAARAWGYPETEAETNFDPLVAMLLSACSIELEKISGEINNSRARVLERLVQLLSPDVLTGALPAHSVVCTTPVENKLTVKEEDQYYISRKLSLVSDNEEPVWKDIFFSPTSEFQLNKASIRFIATDNTLYRLVNGITKEVISQSEPGNELPANSLWLGIDEPGLSLKNSQFYFDLRNEAHKQLFYHQLPKATWYWNDQPITHMPGYGKRSISGEQLDLQAILNRDDDSSGKIKKQINAFYKTNFVTLTDDTNLTAGADNSMLSGIITETFTDKSAKILQQHSLRWICIDFPQTISSNLLHDLVCSINCFPVFNRKVHDLTHRLQEIVNIIPLNTEDIFLDLEEVSNDEGKILNTREFQGKDDNSFALLLRNGGVGRFDERDASTLVDHIVQLLRDESAAFSTLGNDFMNTELKQLQQIINKLEQRLFSKQLTREQIPYLILRNNEQTPWQNIFIRYWSTAGATANNIKAGSILRLYKGSGLEKNQLTFVTTTQGGRNKLSTTESVLTYKSALLSKDRLITSEDIKAFCHYQLGEKVRQIEVDKGIMIHPDQQKGFMKTIDVTIQINRKEFDEMKEKGEDVFWTDNLKLLLEQKSVALFPYRVFLKRTA
ncbi:MAG: type VI secretion system baseplate subunit TssF [Gemmatimonadaceae bacterium]|nr:type VI secretion system baseplate subunit TssF [Chitinophagaceae bacterium]